MPARKLKDVLLVHKVFILVLACLIGLRAHAGVITWENEGSNNTSYSSGSTVSSGNATLTTTWSTVTDGGTFAPTGTADFVTINHGTTGNHAGSLWLSFENSDDDPDDKIIVEFNFDEAVTNLSFSVLDVDYNEPADLQDFVEVEYHTGDNNWVNLTTQTAFWTIGPALVRDNETFGEGWEGDLAAANTSTDGNLNINFGGTAVQAVRIRYFSGDDEPNPNTFQHVAISDMTFDDLPDPMIVTSTADTNTRGTLRYAINHANANPGDDNITFNIAGGGPHTITLSSSLPTVSDDGVTIDATSQGSASCGTVVSGGVHALEVELDAGGGFTTPLIVSADSVSISGFAFINGQAPGVSIQSSADATSVSCNQFGLEADNLTGNGIGTFSSGIQISGTNALSYNNLITNSGDGIRIESGSSGSQSYANRIYGNSWDGFSTNSGASGAFYANSVYSNTELGIDNGGTDGVNANDVGDGDGGSNDLLNFPVLNTIGTDGSTSLTYDFNLDVPSHANGYRIDFYKNTSGDSSGYGEGEIHLGFVDVAHSGGDTNFTGLLSASSAVSLGDSITATTTRKTGASAYDQTSEFAANITAVLSADPLIVTSTADTNTLGTLRYAINHANANAGDDNITFDISGAGPHEITIGSALPTITDNGVSIDGTTETGASCGDLWAGTPHTIMIEIDSGATFLNKFTITAADVVIKGVSMTGAGDGIHATNAARLIAQCNYIGVAPDGTAGNAGSAGVLLEGTSSDALIGGLTAGQGNVLSNQGWGVLTHNGTTGTMIRGNFIGTDPAGTSARPNSTAGINSYSGTVTWSDITKNLISGNNSSGLNLNADDIVSGSSGDVVIAGNYFGIDRTGTTALPNSGDGINFVSGAISGVTIGGTTVADRNVFAGNTGDGIDLSGISNVTILGNYIGVNAAGTAAIHNGITGINLDGGASINIGDGTAAGRNVVGGSNSVIFVSSTPISNLTISGNYLGVASDGATDIASSIAGVGFEEAHITNVTISDNVISGASTAGIGASIDSVIGLTITGNIIGLDAAGSTAVPNGAYGIALTGIGGPYANITIGGTGSGEGNTISGNVQHGIYVSSLTSLSISGNAIYSNGDDGIKFASGTYGAIYANSIYDNGGLGIDLEGIDGVNTNDSGDADSGANDLLNFPVINEVLTDGTVDFDYDFTLDVPVNTDGYRIDFFKSTTADGTGYGEGETHLGSMDVAGAGTYANTFAASVAVEAGDFITATTTRKTGASTYDATSEFSLAYTAGAFLPDLQVSMSVDVYDPLVEGIYALPNNDMVTTLSVVNEGTGSVDAGSINLIIPVSNGLTFYNGDFDDGGPETDSVVFTDVASGLSFNSASNLAFDNGGSKPANFAACSYTPSAGYDPAVTYVCINPSGAMQAGDPDPAFSVQFRSRIE